MDTDTANVSGNATYVGQPGVGSGVVVRARGGWGGRQLTTQIVQRIAVQYGWKDFMR